MTKFIITYHDKGDPDGPRHTWWTRRAVTEDEAVEMFRRASSGSIVEVTKPKAPVLDDGDADTIDQNEVKRGSPQT